MITLNIQGNEYTLKEAKELYHELKVLFGDVPLPAAYRNTEFNAFCKMQAEADGDKVALSDDLNFRAYMKTQKSEQNRKQAMVINTDIMGNETLLPDAHERDTKVDLADYMNEQEQKQAMSISPTEESIVGFMKRNFPQ